jgi:hypothetical protein
VDDLKARAASADQDRRERLTRRLRSAFRQGYETVAPWPDATGLRCGQERIRLYPDRTG